MAGKSLGTLTIDLIAEVGGFVRGMDRAERASEKWAKQVKKDAAATSTALISIGGALQAASLAVGTYGFNLLKSTAEQVNVTEQWAKSLKVSTQELMAWQFAAGKAGLAGDKIADIFKDISDKIGDAVLNKSGEAVDALNALGLSAEKLSKVSPDKQLMAIGAALGKVSSNSVKVNILESLGNDLSKLLPLFENNNAKLNQFIQLSKDYGVAPDPKSIDDLVKVSAIFQDMEAQVSGLKMEIAAGLANVDLSPLNNSLSKVRDVLTDPKTLQGIADLVSEVAQLAGWLVKAAAGAGQLLASSGNRMAAVGGRINMDNPYQVQERIDYLTSLIKNRGNDYYGSSQTFIGWIMGSDDSVKAMSDEVVTLTDHLTKLKQVSKDTKLEPNTKLGSTSLLQDFGLAEGKSNGKAAAIASEHKQISVFKSTENSYLRQIALIDATGTKSQQVKEIQKISFELSTGKLKGLNEAQQQRLKSLALEVDRLNAVKKANQDNARVAAYLSTLQESNANAKQSLDADFIGAGAGNKTRERLRQLAAIRQEFTRQQFDLNRQYSEDGNKDVYDKETTGLKAALDQRLTDQRHYYDQLDILNSDWQLGITDGLQNAIDSSNNLYQQLGNFAQETYNGMSEALANFVLTGKANFKDFTKSVLSDISRIAMQKALAGIAGNIISNFSAAGTGSAASVLSGTGALGLPTSYTGYDDGGFTGKGGKYEPAGIVHKGEFVFTKEATQRIGVDKLYRMMKGYSEGGYVGDLPSNIPRGLNRVAASGAGVVVGDISVTVNGSGQSNASNSATDSTAIAAQIQSAVINTINDQATKQGTPLWRVIKGR